MRISSVLKAQFNIHKRNNLTRSILIITFLLLPLFGFIIHRSSSFTGPLSFLALMKGYENGFNFSLSLTSSAYRILLFFIILMASTTISDEVQKGTIKTTLLKRLKRRIMVSPITSHMLKFL